MVGAFSAPRVAHRSEVTLCRGSYNGDGKSPLRRGISEPSHRIRTQHGELPCHTAHTILTWAVGPCGHTVPPRSEIRFSASATRAEETMPCLRACTKITTIRE